MAKKVREFTPGQRVSYLHFEVGAQDGQDVVFDKRKRYTGVVVSSRLGHEGVYVTIRPDASQKGHPALTDAGTTVIFANQHAVKDVPAKG